jgi:hypothetical protein
MSSKRKRQTNLSAPYLRRVWLDFERIADRTAYPFCLPFLSDDFELDLIAPSRSSSGKNGNR